jgi:hypothetical protein
MVGSECSGVVIAVDFNKIEKRIWPSQSYSTLNLMRFAVKNVVVHALDQLIKGPPIHIN